MPGNRLLVDQIAVATTAGGGVATVLIPQQPYDQRVCIHAPAPGVFVSHHSLALTTEGFAVPANVLLTFEIPAYEGLWAISSAGTIQVSRMFAPVVQKDGGVLRVLLEYLKGLGRVTQNPVQSGGVIKRPSELEMMDPFGAAGALKKR